MKFISLENLSYFWSKVKTYITNALSGYAKTTDIPTVPTRTSQLENDSKYIVQTELAAVATSGQYDDLDNKPTIPPATTVTQVVTSGEEIAKVNNVSIYAPTSAEVAALKQVDLSTYQGTEGEIVQHVGETTSEYTNGLFYKKANSGDTIPSGTRYAIIPENDYNIPPDTYYNTGEYGERRSFRIQGSSSSTTTEPLIYRSLAGNTIEILHSGFPNYVATGTPYGPEELIVYFSGTDYTSEDISIAKWERVETVSENLQRIDESIESVAYTPGGIDVTTASTMRGYYLKFLAYNEVSIDITGIQNNKYINLFGKQFFYDVETVTSGSSKVTFQKMGQLVMASGKIYNNASIAIPSGYVPTEDFLGIGTIAPSTTTYVCTIKVSQQDETISATNCPNLGLYNFSITYSI